MLDSQFCLGYHQLSRDRNLEFIIVVVKDGASFCHCAYVLRISAYSDFLRNLSTNTTIFYDYVYDHMEKADLSKGYQNPKRKLGLTTHFAEIIELAIHSLHFNTFLEIWLLNYL